MTSRGHKKSVKGFLSVAQNEDTQEAIEDFRTFVTSASEEEIVDIESEITATVPVEIEPGSVDEYIYGCLSDVSEMGTSCTPSCANGYKLKDIDECSLAIYEKKDGTIRNLNNKKSTRAFLYTETEQDVTDKDIERITKSNPLLSELFIYTQDESHKYSHTSTRLVKKKKKQTSNLWILFMVVVAIILILVLIKFFFTYNFSSQKTTGILGTQHKSLL